MALVDLNAAIAESHERINKIPLNVPFRPSAAVWKEVVGAYKASSPSDDVQVIDNALVIVTPSGNFLTISAQEIPRCWAVQPYVKAITPYLFVTDQLARQIGFSSRGGGSDVFKKLPSPNWRTEIDPKYIAEIDNAVKTKLGLTLDEQGFLFRFLEDKAWSGVSKTLERADWLVSAIIAAGNWLVVASDRRGDLSKELAKSAAFDALMQAEVSSANALVSGSLGKPDEIPKPAEIGKNYIFYGAPGTGKSKKVNDTVGSVNVERTVFHPDLQNSDFFGCLKPRSDGATVRYDFAPGPFSKILAAALSKPNEQHFLVIEELNRAPAAAVFGELFQLLDREPTGESTYTISYPNVESERWFRDQGVSKARLGIPANLSIVATMNSADQGVYPLDTAFRRRWEQEYLPLNYAAGPTEEIEFIDGSNDTRRIPWRRFVEILNGFLLDRYGVAEDRLLGQWFVKSSELGGKVPAKILLYLWDDLLRHEERERLFAPEIKNYGRLDSYLKSGKQIFSLPFLEGLNKHATPVPSE